MTRFIYANPINGFNLGGLNGKPKPRPNAVRTASSISLGNGHTNTNGKDNRHASASYKHPWLGLGLDGHDSGIASPADDGDDLLEGDPVVISGLACRLPGNVGSPHEFWQMLMQKRSGQCQVPKSRVIAKGT